MQKTAEISFLILLGILCMIAGEIYLTHSANSLPHAFPGFNATETLHHIKHGLAAIILGLGLWVVAWFRSGTSALVQK